MKIFIIISCFLFSKIFLLRIEAQQKSDSLSFFDKNIAERFAYAIYSPNVMIGLFEVQQIRQKPVALESGVIPEEQNGYLDIIIKNNLIKFNLIKSIKGNFDSVIFVKRINPVFSHDENYIPQQIFAFSGSKWLIILKKANLKDSTASWSSSIKTNAVKSFINEKTLFEFAETSYGSLSVGWPENVEKPSELQIAPLAVVNDLQSIIEFDGNLTSMSGNQLEQKRQAASKSLLTSYGKTIFDIVSKHH